MVEIGNPMYEGRERPIAAGIPDAEFKRLETSAVKKAVSIPVIASGGAGTVDHIKDALDVADAALLASLLHYGELTVGQIKDHLAQHGITVRT